MDQPLHSSNADIPVSNGHKSTNGTNGTNDIKEDNLVDAAKSPAADIINGIKGLVVN